MTEQNLAFGGALFLIAKKLRTVAFYK